MNYTLGMDPEFLVVGGDGRCLDIRHLIPGTKKKPVPIPWRPSDGWTVQLDGLAIELGCGPVRCGSPHYTSIFGSMVGSAAVVAQEVIDKFVKPEIPEATLASDDWLSYPEGVSDDEVEYGCDSDRNLYQQPGERELGVATAGWHVHIGLPSSAIPPEVLVNFLDATYARCFPELWQNSRSKVITGGTYRVKPYGIEYRVPSRRISESPELAGVFVRAAVCIFEAAHKDPGQAYAWWKGVEWGNLHSWKHFFDYAVPDVMRSAPAYKGLERMLRRREEG